MAIGKFDGIHVGHKELIHKINEKKKDGFKSVVFTFDPPPSVFFGGKDVKVLTTREEKRALFESMGVDILIEFPMNRETAATSPENFIERYLVKQMCAGYIVAGSDLSFGDRGAGNCELLRKYADTYHYCVEIIDKIRRGDTEISSTYVRELIERGEVKSAAECLGEYYSVIGLIMPGKQLGRKLGMPTINVIPEEEKLLPAYGVYYSEVNVEDTTYAAITNIGCKPTVNDDIRPLAESYLYDFSGDLYGKNAVVRLMEFKRPEQKFDGIDALKAQMQEDIAQGKTYHLAKNDI